MKANGVVLDRQQRDRMERASNRINLGTTAVSLGNPNYGSTAPRMTGKWSSLLDDHVNQILKVEGHSSPVKAISRFDGTTCSDQQAFSAVVVDQIHSFFTSLCHIRCGDIDNRCNAQPETQMSHDVAANTQHTAFMKDVARKIRREAEEAKAHLSLAPVDGHLNQSQISFGELADKVEEAALRCVKVAK